MPSVGGKLTPAAFQPGWECPRDRGKRMPRPGRLGSRSVLLAFSASFAVTPRPFWAVQRRPHGLLVELRIRWASIPPDEHDRDGEKQGTKDPSVQAVVRRCTKRDARADVVPGDSGRAAGAVSVTVSVRFSGRPAEIGPIRAARPASATGLPIEPTSDPRSLANQSPLCYPSS